MSRQRRKQQAEDAERRCGELRVQNAQLAGMVARLSADNAALRQQLAAEKALNTGGQAPQAGPAAAVPPPVSGPPRAVDPASPAAAGASLATSKVGFCAFASMSCRSCCRKEGCFAFESDLPF